MDRKFTLHKFGRVSVVIKAIPDDYPDYSHLGRFCDFTRPTGSDLLVHMDSGSVMGSDGIWRNEKGRIVSEPYYYRRSREYRFTYHDNCTDRLKYAVADSQRMKDLNDGYWCYLVIVASVYYAGVEIASFCCGGLESDSEESCLMSEARSIAHEALTDARSWLNANCCR